MKLTMRVLICCSLTLMSTTALAADESPLKTATIQQGNHCNVRSEEEVMSEPLCGNDAACAARKKAELDQSLEAHKCEMERLMLSPL